MKKFIKYVGLFIKHLLRFVLKPLSFVPALCVMYMIYTFSAQDGATSAQLSYKVSSKIVTTADQVLSLQLTGAQREAYIDRIHFYVRKTAHFSEYLLLAVTIALPLYVYRVRGIWLIVLAGAFCVGFACLDEYHQSFVAGRASAKRDVIIDSCGAFTGILLAQFVCFIGRKTIFRPLSMHD
ncbi:MAG: VanZ family protein [Lachnospiraceae bacterium]|nr:VanZ family protein [Lachnospiraceae bacterium]